ncbi:MAG: hypothetical protein J6D03_00735 [Clostridia bacterium]|nr:hypothetical protein [Clostridia bacterium]
MKTFTIIKQTVNEDCQDTVEALFLGNTKDECNEYLDKIQDEISKHYKIKRMPDYLFAYLDVTPNSRRKFIYRIYYKILEFDING